jgi:hypothetical protein
MPAIQPARLRLQAALLAAHFDQPAAYVRSLHHLLELYADRARRQGLTAPPPTLLEAYHVRPPVLRQVIRELEPLVGEYPDEILSLCDALWQEAVLEFRLTAISLTGKVAPFPAARVTERLEGWIGTQPGRRLVEAILGEGCGKLRQENPQAYLDMVSAWLEAEDVSAQQVGLQALVYLVDDPGYQNLPVIFMLLEPFLVSPPAVLRPDVLQLIRLLAARAPQESAYILRRLLQDPENEAIPFLLRQSVASFPEHLQGSLIEELRLVRSRKG